MPQLTALYEKYDDLRDHFEIIAFHDARVQSFEELDEKLIPIEKDDWNGQPLPFPILLDSTGQTIKSFGISAFPTLILIDPDGKLVKGRAQESLEEILEKLTAEKSAQKLRY